MTQHADSSCRSLTIQYDTISGGRIQRRYIVITIGPLRPGHWEFLSSERSAHTGRRPPAGIKRARGARSTSLCRQLELPL